MFVNTLVCLFILLNTIVLWYDLSPLALYMAHITRLEQNTSLVS